MAATPRFPEPLHVGRPNVGDRTRLFERLDGALDRLVLTNSGPLSLEFEQRISELTGAKHCIATVNATTGIQMAVRAAGIRAGQKVIVPSFTWVATAHALDWIGVVPVFCDADPKSGTADPAHVEALIEPDTAGILAVHVFGYPCMVDALEKVADKYGLPLIFDAAHAFGSTYQGKPIGGFGAAEVFSFHATKWINSFEGGAITTDDDELAVKLRGMRNLGLSVDHEHTWTGTAGRMNEAAAAMGLTSLEIMDELFAVNERNHRLYQEGLAGVPGVRVRPMAPGERANHQYIVIEIDEAVSGVHRDRVHTEMFANNILTRRYFHPGCHQVEPYRSAPHVHAPQPLPRTEALVEQVLALPNGMAIGPAEISGVCEVIAEVVDAA
ncbi:DegT/DnrJ/EryC1/StrS family aminotransferase [Amycolatopsis sp. NPDC098790]|uniref:DegT/DnrJ/EryC1/StrS family aminotransferase n=1 Tax=Amycolatopsis sp. NPDC098790 TaxID=3363939 RepID=UPI003830DE07